MVSAVDGRELRETLTHLGWGSGLLWFGWFSVLLVVNLYFLGEVSMHRRNSTEADLLSGLKESPCS